MHKIMTLALVTAAFAAPAVAQDSQSDISADKGAIHKDNSAISGDHSQLAKDRAAKAADKANGDYGSQAVDSVKIGADQTAIGEKKTEKDVDQKILQHHENSTGQ